MADHRHKRDTNARRKPKAIVIAGPLAFLATASAVSLGVLTHDPDVRDVTIAATDVAAPPAGDVPDVPAVSRDTFSRSASRVVIKPLTKTEKMLAPVAVREAVRAADTRLWTTEVLNLWSAPGEKAAEVGQIDEGEKVLVTGRSLHGRDEVVVDGTSRWVTSGYLVAEKPEPEPEEIAVETASCTNGTSVASGVSPNVVAVHQAVCAAFPEITTYGTFRSDGEHGQGIAVDIMVSGDRGWEVAEFVRANYSELGVNYLIYAQQIWSVDRSGEGWRGMSDRGSTTANHYDHVHVTTY